MEVIVKPFWQDTTFWLAALQAIAGALAVFYTAFPLIGWIAVAKSIVDIIVRAMADPAPIGLVGRYK